MKSKLSLLVAITVAISSAFTVYAEESPIAGTSEPITVEGSSSSVPMNITAEPLAFSVTLPASLPIAVDSTGQVFTADNAVITNNSSADVSISNLEIKAGEGWTLDDFDMYVEADNTMALDVGGVKSTGSDRTSFTAESFEPITNGGGTLEVPYNAKLPTFYDPVDGVQIASAIFTIGWANASPEQSYPTMKHVFLGNFVANDFSVDPKTLTKIEFVTDMPEGITKTVDISEGKDKSVLAGIQDTTLYISSEGSSKIFAPLNSQKLFSYSTNTAYMLTNVISIENLQMLDTSKVTDMNDMFSECKSLKTLDLSTFDTSQVTSMRSMFSRCNSLTTLDLSTFDTSQVTDMDYMFSECKSLKTLDLSAFDTSQVTSMNSMFNDCFSLTTLDLSAFDTSQVTSIHFMFRGCRALKTLDLSSFDTSKVTSTDLMLSECNSLTTCYGRTEEDCARLNSSFMKPSNVNFVVKH